MKRKKDIAYNEMPGIVNDVITKHDYSTAVQNGFRKCGIFPWCPDAADYSKCLASTLEKPWENEKITAGPDISPPVEGKTFMDIFDEQLREYLSDIGEFNVHENRYVGENFHEE